MEQLFVGICGALPRADSHLQDAVVVAQPAAHADQLAVTRMLKAVAGGIRVTLICAKTCHVTHGTA